MSSSRARLAAFLSLAVTAVGCGEDAAPAAPGSASAAGEPAPDEAPGVTSAPAEAPSVVRFDFARHAARAELFHGAARLVDLGAASGHQHTLGGWRTRVGETRTFDGASTSLLRGVTGFFVVPLEAGRCHLSLRMRSFASPTATLYVDDETVANVRVPTDGSFAVVQAEIPAARCTDGEHTVRLRVPQTDGGVGLAVDWIRVGTADDAESGPPASLGDATTLRLPSGHRAAFSFEVPEEARLTGVARGTGSLTVHVDRDGAARESLPAIAASAEGAPFDLDLSRFAPHVARVSLAFEGELAVLEPRVVSPRAAEPREAPRLRNVLVYLTDTLRADHLRAYAPETRVETPGLSAWASRSATFIAGHSQENWTKPSVATLLSGLFPWEHHATTEDAIVPDSVELLGERLRGEGFHTGAFIANGFVSESFGFRQGWSTFRNYVREGRPNLARFVAADVIAWLEARPDDQPFFLYVHTIDPHVPYMPPDEDLRRYDPEPYEGPVDFGRDRALLESVKSGALRLNERDRVRLEALYDGEITYHDRHFASVMEALSRRGLEDETLVVFTADHGEELWDHGSVGHGHSVWEELIRVPLIVRWPGLTDGGTRVSEAVGLVDVMPTALDAVGLPVPEALSGRSLAPLLRGIPEDAPRPVVTGFMDGWRTIVVGRYKLIQRTPSAWQLYDLVADPREQRDLAPERPIAVRYLRGLLGMSLAESERGPAHDAARTVIDATTREQLEALGYAGASRAPTSDGAD